MAREPLRLVTDAGATEAKPAADAISSRILDAALDTAAAFGLQNLTMDAVARRAEVGRMTVYRRFGDKEGLLAALGERESRRCLAEMDAAAPHDAPIAEQAAAGFATALRLSREHPLLSRLARLEPEAVLSALTDNGGAMFVVLRFGLAERLRAAQKAGVLGEIEIEETAELMVRLAVSFVLIPESILPLDDEQQVRGVAHQLLTPILEP
jgi:AcrR family transcriptional regulator